MKSAFVLAATLVAAASTPAWATSPCAQGGELAVWRLDKITGTRTGFEKAVHDHLAWYRAHGVTSNDIVVVDVLLTAPDGKPMVSKDEAITIHYNPPRERIRVPSRTEWDKFVAEYKANSTIEVEKMVCLPKR